MADIAQAGLLIVPHFDGLESSINTALAKATGSVNRTADTIGRGAGESYGKGMMKAGVVAGAVSTVTSKALDAITSRVDDAVSRFDTLNNYPRVMQSLGYSADAAEASIAKMSDHLLGLPTSLDSMTSTVQGISVITGDLDRATDAGLALNDMLLASGSSLQLTGAASEQFRQMLSKGKPDMQDWKSLVQAMPGQLDQLAKSMLGPTATANDLYAALGGGKAQATHSMDDLLDAMIRLDREGTASVTSFAEQAKMATGGVATSAENLGTAITRGLAGTLDAVGRERISGAFKGLSSTVTEAFKVINGIVRDVAPVVSGAIEGIAGAADTLGPALVGAFALSKVAAPAKGIASEARRVGEALSLARGGAGTLREALAATGSSLSGLRLAINPLGIALAGAGLVVGAVVKSYIDWKRHTDAVSKATDGLRRAVADTGSLTSYKGVMDSIGESQRRSALSVKDLMEANARRAQSMQEVTGKAQEQLGALNLAQRYIQQYTGKTDLSTEAQGKLKWAIDEVNGKFGTTLSMQDAMNGYYTDQQGNVQNLKDSINELIEAKKREIAVDAASKNLTTAYQAQMDAATTLAGIQKDYEDRYNSALAYARSNPNMIGGQSAEDYATRWASRERERMDEARKAYDSASESVSRLEAQLGDLEAATGKSADAFTEAASSNALFAEQVRAHGQSVQGLADDLRELGVDTEKFKSLSSDQLAKLASDYDGTTASIVGDLREWGVGMSDAADGLAELSRSVGGIDGLADAFTSAGVNVNDFTTALYGAGVSTEQLNAIGSDNLLQLARNCQGNVDLMVWEIQHYNDTPLIDKDGTVNVDDASLIDAQGHVYTWNGTDFVDKDGHAAVNDTSLIDAQGHVYTWNGTSLEYKSADGTVYHASIADGIAERDEWNRDGLNSYTAKNKITTVFDNIINRITGSQNARGGFMMHASGGYIVNRPTVVGVTGSTVHIAGEDGAEWIEPHAGGIIPLTNRKYTQPFANAVADGIKARQGQPRAAKVTQNFYIRTDDPELVAALVARRQRRAYATA